MEIKIDAAKSLTTYNFFRDLIFNPSHAKQEDQLKCKVITAALTVFSVGIIPACVAISWAVSRLITWITSTSKIAEKVANLVTSDVRIEKGPGFPSVSKKKKDNARKITKAKLESLVNVKSDKIGIGALTDAGKDLMPLMKHREIARTISKTWPA